MGKTLSINLIYFVLANIVILGFILRFLFLGDLPVSLHRDEAFLGYNAYSILMTGRDISGHLMPLHLESFLYSPAGYSYFSMPFIAALGLSEFSVRAASALFGSLTVFVIYLLSLEFFEKNKSKYKIALFSALFLAILPWHINLSRVAVENTIVTFFVSLGILLYLKYLKQGSLSLLIISYTAFFLTLFTYQAPRAFLPLFIPFLWVCLIGIKGTLTSKFQIFLYFLLVVLPVVLVISSPELSTRIQGLSILSHPETQLTINEELTNDALSGAPTLISRVFHNKISGYSFLFLDNYFSHLSYDFLFSDGGLPERFKIPFSGLLHVYQLPLILISLVFLYLKNKKIGVILAGWIGLSIFGSAITYDDIPNLQRTLVASPAFAILSGYGLYVVLERIRKDRFLMPLGGLIVFVMILSLFYFVFQYYTQGRVYKSWYRQDGYRELVIRANALLPAYDRVVITARETAPSIFFLFYSKYDSAKFQKETKLVDMTQSDHVNFSKFVFSDEECPLRIDNKTHKFTGEKGTLYVNSALCDENMPNVRLISRIRRVGGSEVFHILSLE